MHLFVLAVPIIFYYVNKAQRPMIPKDINNLNKQCGTHLTGEEITGLLPSRAIFITCFSIKRKIITNCLVFCAAGMRCVSANSGRIRRLNANCCGDHGNSIRARNSQCTDTCICICFCVLGSKIEHTRIIVSQLKSGYAITIKC